LLNRMVTPVVDLIATIVRHFFWVVNIVHIP
jgi:hypothetical protein